MSKTCLGSANPWAEVARHQICITKFYLLRTTLKIGGSESLVRTENGDMPYRDNETESHRKMLINRSNKRKLW